MVNGRHNEMNMIFIDHFEDECGYFTFQSQYSMHDNITTAKPRLPYRFGLYSEITSIDLAMWPTYKYKESYKQNYSIDFFKRFPSKRNLYKSNKIPSLRTKQH